jgi:hypothetical protein
MLSGLKPGLSEYKEDSLLLGNITAISIFDILKIRSSASPGECRSSVLTDRS